MWTRGMLKDYAKQELRISYWLSFLVCLVGGILGGGSGGGGISFNFNDTDLRNGFADGFQGGFRSGYGGYGSAASFYVVIAVIVVALIIFAFAICLGVFLANPIRVGLCSFFIRAPYGDREFRNLFSSFKHGRYMQIVKAMLLTDVTVFLWSLLLIIPGIVKSYEYRMVPYIMSEDPSLSPRQAMELSRQMTDGEKFDMWVLDLSFIGWYLLGTLALFIGVLFVTPYVEATWTQLYFVLRQKVLAPPRNPAYPAY